MDLSLLWFVIVGVMLVAYFILDGFDFGVGMSLPFLGRDDVERRQLINTIGPVWDLNETWLIVAGACMFAAFPEWYATLFSGMYLPLLLILVALILRAVSFEYRHQRPDARWRAWVDRSIVFGSVVPAFVWGLVFANLAQGLEMQANPAGGALYSGGLLGLLSPYALLGGITTLTLFFFHGLVFVALKTTDEMRERAQRLASRAGLVAIVAAASLLVWTVVMVPHPAVIVAAALAAIALVGAWIANARGREGVAFTLTAATVLLAVSTLLLTLLLRDGGPFVMPASNPTGDFIGLTVANASSSTTTLTVMTWTALIAMPLVLAYQAWTYWVFRKRVTRAAIEAAAH